MSPSPLMRDVGSNTNAPANVKWTAPTPAPPLSNGMWAAYSCVMEELGRKDNQGEPMKSEAHVVRRENGPRQMSWPVFSYPSSIDPSDEIRTTQHLAATEERRQR